jgi:ribosomal protein L37AE/L43A
MRWILTVIAAVSVIGASLVTPASAEAKKPAVSHKGQYECPKCHLESTKAGKCPHCKVALVAEGAHPHYECKKCRTTAAKAGKCPKCKATMTKVAGTDSHKGHKH